MKEITATCSKCGEVIEQEHEDHTIGFAYDLNGNKICYCGQMDRQYMRDNGRISLYMVKPEYEFGNCPQCDIINWQGSLKFKGLVYRKGRHNWAGTRYDVDFIFEGYIWHGVKYGENTKIIHCRRTKQIFTFNKMRSFSRRYQQNNKTGEQQ